MKVLIKKSVLAALCCDERNLSTVELTIFFSNVLNQSLYACDCKAELNSGTLIGYP